MPLHLSQHKSYHPYNRGNQERVLRDQALAAQQKEQQRQSAFVQRDQARLEALRTGRQDLETSRATRQHLRPTPAPSDHQRGLNSHSRPQSGHALLRPEDELVPWYTTSQLRNGAEARKSDDQRLEDAYKDSTTKSSNDPLKAMQTFLAQRKAAKDLPQRDDSRTLIGNNVSDHYEPEAVRSAQSRRRHSARTHSSPSPTLSRNSSSRAQRKHRTDEAACHQTAGSEANKRHRRSAR